MSETPPADAKAKVGSAWKWWLTIVLFLATVLTYLDRQTMSLCGAMICKEFNLSNEQYGQLVSAFRWAYAPTHVVAGFMADRVAIRPTYAVAVGLWSAAGASAAFVFGFGRLLFTRAFLGVGEAFNWPCATRIVANMLPPEDRGLASGIFSSGAAVGSMVAPLIITPIAVRFGWRWAFFIIGAIGVFWIILWLFSTRRGSAAHSAVSRVERAEPGTARQAGVMLSVASWFRQILLHPAFWMLFIVAITVNPCWYFLNEWIPKYMHDQWGMGYLSAGLVTIPIFLGADLGNILSGGLIKLLAIRGWSIRRARGTVLALAALLTVPVAFITGFASVYACVVLLGLAGMGLTSIEANYTACQQDFSFANVGIVSGILGMSANVFAAVVNPHIGRYVDRTGHYTLIFVFMAILPAVSLAAILVFDTLISRRGPTMKRIAAEE